MTQERWQQVERIDEAAVARESLAPGQQVGPYQILSTLGAGGMGEIYRAHDTKLGRDVALKIVPSVFASDADRRARFEREARMLARLNHPHIATIYGLEAFPGGGAIAMELVEGPTLADRIARGPLAVDEALAIAVQIGEALEAAHEQGIVHRDLKPANIKLRADGTVKVLDFGLARVTHEAARAAMTGASASPTITAAAQGPGDLVTRAGTLLGTAPYMSPEQARGDEVDHRTDIWAFGCVLYEMLTGRTAFGAATMTEALAKVLEGHADLRALPAATPPAIRRLVRRCLERSPRNRLQHIGDARTDITDILEGAPDLAVGGDAAGNARRGLWAAAAGVAVLAAAGAWFAAARGAPASPAATPIRFEVPRLQGPPFGTLSRTIALSPDGSRLVYATPASLRLRSLAGDDVALAAAGHQAFFSPDGEWLAFFSDEGLQRMPASGGPAELITPQGAGTERNAGGSWGDGGAIVVSVGGSLLRVRDGGTAEVLARPDAAAGEIRYAWPEFLPGGRSLLFTVFTDGGPADARIDVIDLTGENRRTLLRGGHAARYLPTGHLVYAAGGRLHVVGFDPQRRELRSAPVTVEGVEVAETTGGVSADFAVSATGTLAYLPPVSRPLRTLAWVDRDGREEPIPAPVMAYVYPRLSPDGTRMAVDILGANRDISVWDFTRRVMTKITDGPTENLSPTWSPDGTRVFFGSDRAGGAFRIYSVAADGAGPAREEFAGPDSYISQSMPAPNQMLAYATGAGTRDGDVALITLTGGGSVRTLLGGSGGDVNAQVSPDGRWVVYQSNESGQAEVYLRPYPDVDRRREQISAGGGVQPLWGPQGSNELFYWTLNGALKVVSVTLTPDLRIGTTRDVALGDGYLPGGFGTAWSYQVSPVDGRLLLMKPVPGSEGPTPIKVVVNWHEELRRLGQR